MTDAFSHMYGLLQGVLVPVSGRGETVILERFQPEYIVELIVRHGATFFRGRPSAIYAATGGKQPGEWRLVDPQDMPGRL